jgi:hypothetical protein
MTETEAPKGNYRYDFSRFLTKDYLRLEDKTARFILNTADQLVDGRTHHVDRPFHYPFTHPYLFVGNVYGPAEPAVILTIAERGLGIKELGILDMQFQRVKDVIQAAGEYVNRTQRLPENQQVHGLFGVLLPYAEAMCQKVSDYEGKPVVHAVRIPPERSRWVPLLETAGYESHEEGSTYVRKYLPSVVHPPKEVAFVKPQRF